MISTSFSKGGGLEKRKNFSHQTSKRNGEIQLLQVKSYQYSGLNFDDDQSLKTEFIFLRVSRDLYRITRTISAFLVKMFTHSRHCHPPPCSVRWSVTSHANAILFINQCCPQEIHLRSSKTLSNKLMLLLNRESSRGKHLLIPSNYSFFRAMFWIPTERTLARG